MGHLVIRSPRASFRQGNGRLLHFCNGLRQGFVRGFFNVAIRGRPRNVFHEGATLVTMRCLILASFTNDNLVLRSNHFVIGVRMKRDVHTTFIAG